MKDMDTNKKPVAGRAPWTREDALVWALRVAETQVPVSDVLADASVIGAYLDGDFAPTERAIATVQRYRDRIGSGPVEAASVDEYLCDLIRDLRETIIDAEIVNEEPES
ncbi:hypothetical protein [Leucobacter ruminantium]|uniref:Uncharacterized protein n=1 Tax=Leucobacter ruminantium TaxID=1289170 RepID=A0A939RZV5_9MICO|nr:hypothetical protein [Leucobacter ruminantium]MBO1805869.1 hypothetical protein [Leucobacter ruminantium]